MSVSDALGIARAWPAKEEMVRFTKPVGAPRWISLLAVALVVALAASLTACGGGDDDTSGDATGDATSTTTEGSPATGPTVNVWSVFPEGVPGASAPEVSGGIKAAFRYLNDHGGLGPDHSKVVVKTCNTQLSAQGETQCATQAARDSRAIAVVTPLLVTAPTQFMGILEEADLPAINLPIDPDTPKNPMSFAPWSPGIGMAGCAAMLPEATGAKSLVIAGTALPTVEYQMEQGKAAAEASGSTIAGEVLFPVTAPDLAPFVTQAADTDADATLLSGSPQQTGSWLSAAARLGELQPVCSFDGLFAPKALIGLGEQASDVYVAGFFPDVAAEGYPLFEDLREQAEAEVAAGDDAASLDPGAVTQQVAAGWLGSQVVIQAAEGIKGPVTRASFLEALEKAKVSFGSGDEAVLPEIDFSKPNQDPRWPRFFNTKMILKKWDPASQAFVVVEDVPPVTAEEVLPKE